MMEKLWKRRLSITKVALMTGLIVAGILAQTPDPPAPPAQPLPFSHKTHAGQLELKCLSCHTNPAPGEKMTYPATSMCMSCHEEIAADKPSIKKLAEYHKSKESVPWKPIYRNPAWVFFSHQVHLDAGAKCDRCHGQVSERDALWREKDISMKSCMRCHREYNASTACDYCHESQ